MKEQIRQRARDLGFDGCRFAAADPPDHAAEFQTWLGSKRHGEMGYLERNAFKRVNPQQVLPGARSVITLAVSYGERNPEFQQPRDGGPSTSAAGQCPGRVARYARGKDYHDVLAAPLTQLGDFINHIGGGATKSLWYVDTGPILERDFAQRSGIGFIGKHTNVISREMGNWLFLAEIITTLEIDPDPPERNRCGSCARCIAACPTAAITAPFELDARRCISYLTIELKGSIPVELRPAIGNRIFGCDDCLAVCPWNRFAREGRLMKSQMRPESGVLDLIGLLGLDEAAFRRQFEGTPVLRVKRRGLLRNACVALGNVGDASALPALQKAASDPEALIAEHARWAIERITRG